MSINKHRFLALGASLALASPFASAAESDDTVIVTGERISIRDPMSWDD